MKYIIYVNANNNNCKTTNCLISLPGTYYKHYYPKHYGGYGGYGKGFYGGYGGYGRGYGGFGGGFGGIGGGFIGGYGGYDWWTRHL